MWILRFCSRSFFFRYTCSFEQVRLWNQKLYLGFKNSYLLVIYENLIIIAETQILRSNLILQRFFKKSKEILGGHGHARGIPTRSRHGSVTHGTVTARSKPDKIANSEQSLYHFLFFLHNISRFYFFIFKKKYN